MTHFPDPGTMTACGPISNRLAICSTAPKPATQRPSLDREQAAQPPAWATDSSVQLLAHLLDPERTPASQAIQQEMERKLTGAIAALGDDDREVIWMRHYEQLGNQEVAEALGLS